MRPSISFCIPTYNRLDTLTQAVESVLAIIELNTIDYEVLISDDGHSDKTKTYVENLGNVNIKYHANEVKGQFNNLNSLITKSNKDWIVFLHDDDFLLENYLVQVFAALVKHPDVDYLWGARDLMNAAGHIFKTIKGNSEDSHLLLDSKEYFLECFTTNDYTKQGKVIYPMVTGLMVKRSLAEKIMFDPIHVVNADNLFLWKLTNNATQGVYVNVAIICYRWLEDTERAKPSELGITFTELEAMLYKMNDHLENFLSKETYLEVTRKAKSNFYKHCIGLDSVLMWISLRYKGGYFNRLKKNAEILGKVYRFSPEAYLNPFSLFSVFLSFMPKFMLQPLYGIFLLLRTQ